MAIIKKKELSGMTATQMKAKLVDVEGELYRELGVIKNGGRAQSPGKIKELRRTAARLRTLLARSAEGKIEAKKEAKKNEVKASA